jgi:hypothetical protein
VGDDEPYLYALILIVLLAHRLLVYAWSKLDRPDDDGMIEKREIE